jgi:DNA-binding beta-propeller fold protein YncE
VVETELHRPETAAFQAQALIEEARRLHGRRQRKLAFFLIAVVLLLGITVSVVGLSVSSSQPTAKAPPRLGSSTEADDTAYVTTSDGIVKVNLSSKEILGRITPHGSQLALDPIAIAPDGRTAYVVSDNVLTPIDLRSGLAKAPITLGSTTGGTADSTGFPSSIAIAPNGQTAYVAIPGQGTIAPVHLASLSAANPIALGGTPRSIVIAPNGVTAYVTNSTTGSIDVVNLLTDSVDLPINGIVDPQQIALTPNGQTAYVGTGSAVVPIDLTSGRLLAPIGVGSIGAGFGPELIVVSPDGRFVYAANTESATGNAVVSVVNTASNTVVARLGGFSGPVGISLDDRSHTLYVLNTAPTAGSVIRGVTGKNSPVDENALVPIDLGARRVQASISLPATPRAFGIGRE